MLSKPLAASQISGLQRGAELICLIVLLCSQLALHIAVSPSAFSTCHAYCEDVVLRGTFMTKMTAILDSRWPASVDASRAVLPIIFWWVLAGPDAGSPASLAPGDICIQGGTGQSSWQGQGQRGPAVAATACPESLGPQQH